MASSVTFCLTREIQQREFRLLNFITRHPDPTKNRKAITQYRNQMGATLSVGNWKDANRWLAGLRAFRHQPSPEANTAPGCLRQTQKGNLKFKVSRPREQGLTPEAMLELREVMEARHSLKASTSTADSEFQSTEKTAVQLTSAEERLRRFYENLIKLK
jgi:hypothetical protein